MVVFARPQTLRMVKNRNDQRQVALPLTWLSLNANGNHPRRRRSSMQYRCRAFVILLPAILCMALGAHSPTKAWAQPEKGMTVIHVIGSSEIKGDNVQAARESAINNGMISAVSQVIMEMLPADAVTSHFQVINEVILSKTDPYVRDFKVLSESTQAKIYRILVQATVSKTRLADAFKRAGVGLQERQALRILLCVAEKGLADLTYRYWWGSQ